MFLCIYSYVAIKEKEDHISVTEYIVLAYVVSFTTEEIHQVRGFQKKTRTPWVDVIRSCELTQNTSINDFSKLICKYFLENFVTKRGIYKRKGFQVCFSIISFETLTFLRIRLQQNFLLFVFLFCSFFKRSTLRGKPRWLTTSQIDGIWSTSQPSPPTTLALLFAFTPLPGMLVILCSHWMSGYGSWGYSTCFIFTASWDPMWSWSIEWYV